MWQVYVLKSNLEFDGELYIDTSDYYKEDTDFNFNTNELIRYGVDDHYVVELDKSSKRDWALLNMMLTMMLLIFLRYGPGYDDE